MLSAVAAPGRAHRHRCGHDIALADTGERRNALSFSTTLDRPFLNIVLSRALPYVHAVALGPSHPRGARPRAMCYVPFTARYRYELGGAVIPSGAAPRLWDDLGFPGNMLARNECADAFGLKHVGVARALKANVRARWPGGGN